MNVTNEGRSGDKEEIMTRGGAREDLMAMGEHYVENCELLGGNKAESSSSSRLESQKRNKENLGKKRGGNAGIKPCLEELTKV